MGSAYDKNKLLWIATSAGLCRSDGHKVTRFTNIPQLFNGSLIRGEDGKLYSVPLDYPDSVEVFDPGTLLASGARLSWAGQGNFGGTYQQPDHPFYFATGSGIYMLQADLEVELVHQLPSELQPGDQLVAASDTDYVIFQRKTNHFLVVEGGMSRQFASPGGQEVNTFFADKSGTLWVSQQAGLFRKAADETSFSAFPTSMDGSKVNFFMEDLQGNLLISYLSPVSKRVKSLEMITPNGQVSNADWLIGIDERIQSISGEDFSKEIRLNTYGGLYQVLLPQAREGVFMRYLYRELMPGKFGDVMRGFAADDQGNVYVNKDSSMPFWFRVNANTLELDTIPIIEADGTLARHYGCGNNLLNYQGDIFGFSCDIDGDTYLGKIYRYRPANNSWKRWDLPHRSEVVRWILEGRTEGELMLFTEERKDHLRGNIFYFYPAQDSFSLVQPAGPTFFLKGFTKVVVRDTARACIWIGTNAAFYRFDPVSEKLTTYHMSGGKGTSVVDIQLLSSGDLLLGTLHAGLQLFDPTTGEFSRVGGLSQDLDGLSDLEKYLELPSNAIASVKIIDDKYLMIFTFNGLVFHGTTAGFSSVFTTENGLGSNEFNSASIFYNKHDDRWYAGGINGFVSFFIEDLLPKQSLFTPSLLAYRILDENVGYETSHRIPANWTGPLVLPPSVIYCVLEFTIPDYLNGGKQHYQTFLENFDPDWSPSSEVSSVRYTRLEPGKYNFKLQAYDGQGFLSPTIVELPIVVQMPWYETWWFYLSCLLLFCLLFYVFHRVRMKRLEQKMEMTRRMQSLELRTLRQQLNPHFISNAMNAIREYIQRDNAEESARYLTDFSRMMRLFLEASRRKMTSVTDEVDMLQRYIGLEALRFPDRFDSLITIDPEIDPDMDEVPSLLLQPIVENAINHGLCPLESGGELRIHFGLDPADDDVLICTISDNGVGRKIAAERQKPDTHVSRATTILEDRQRLLAEDEQIVLRIDTSDLYPEREHTGTVVTIRIEGHH